MRIRRFLAVGLSIALTGCAGAPAGPSLTPGPAPDPGLLPGDALQVQVWQEEGLSGEFLVSTEGLAFLPLLGERKVTGIPVPQLEGGRIKRCVKRKATYLSAEEGLIHSGSRVAARGKGTSPHEEGYRRSGYGVHYADV